MSKLLFSRLLGAAADQALLSLVNFAVSILLIRLAPKSEYGLYVLFLAPIYLIQGIQNALLLSPYTTRLPGKQCTSRETALTVVAIGHTLLAGIVLLVAVIGVDAYAAWKELPFRSSLNLCVAFGAVGWILREAARALQYAEGSVAGALRGNLIYSAVVVAYLTYAWMTGEVRVEGVFVAIGAGGVLSVVRIDTGTLGTERFFEELSGFWRLGRWAIIGVVLTWFNSNFYPFFAETKFGLEALADMSAARLFLMPFVLLLPAWNNHYRPEFARWHLAGQHARIGLVTQTSAILIGAILAIYGLLLWTFEQELSLVIGRKYQGIGHLVVAWCIYFALFAFRGIYQAPLMLDVAGYRNLSKVSTVSFFILWPALYLSVGAGPVGIIYVLTTIELFQWLLIRHLALRYWDGSQAR